jgi:diacylglycerol kinase family enzyme
MIALVVKPKLLESKRFKKVFDELSHLKPVILSGNDSATLRAEISELRNLDSDLTVVACGGDGTFHLALNAIPDLTVPLAVIPSQSRRA